MILDDIVEHKRHEVATSKRYKTIEDLEQEIDKSTAPRDFEAALRKPGISLIAEIKRASPSRGNILPDVDITKIAQTYENSGARALSILTDTKYFKGSLDDIRSVRSVVALPCLRKEFIIDPYQIVEARAAGADAILLIVRILEDDTLQSFHDLAVSLGLGVLVETHNEKELDRALAIGAHIIGVNNRDLDTLKMDLDLSIRLRNRVPKERVMVSESGIYTREHVQRMEDAGADAILVGESLLTSGDIESKIMELLGHAATE